MNYKDIAKEYGLTLDKHNCVEGFGTFETEHVSTLYFYAAMMDGDNGLDEYSADNELVFEISEEDAKAADLRGCEGKYFRLWLRDDGFVCGSVVNKEELIPVV